MYLDSTTSLAIQGGEEPTEEGEEIALDWRTELETYLKDGIISGDPKIAFPLIRREKHFVMLDEVFFKKSFGSPLLWCLGPEEADEILREIYEGCCGNHWGGHTCPKIYIGRLFLTHFESRCCFVG